MKNTVDLVISAVVAVVGWFAYQHLGVAAEGVDRGGVGGFGRVPVDAGGGVREVDFGGLCVDTG